MKLTIYEKSQFVLQGYICHYIGSFSWVCRDINTTQHLAS